MKRIGIAIQTAWLIVRMAKQSSVATRRNHDAVNGPWVETHGYPHMSLRDIRVVIYRNDVIRTPPLCGKMAPAFTSTITITGMNRIGGFRKLRGLCGFVRKSFLTTDCTDDTDGPCIRMIRGSMFVLRALCVLIAKFWKNKIAGDRSTKIPVFLVR
jgi:hypothetical protein